MVVVAVLVFRSQSTILVSGFGLEKEAELLSTFRSHDEVINPRFVWL